MHNQIVDIHCHILPGLDDGAKNMNESVQMVEQAYNQGIRKIIATPHFIPGEIDPDINHIRDKISQLQNKIAIMGLDLTIYPGMELYLCRELIDEIDRNNILPLADSYYVLVEFSNNQGFSEILELLYEIKIRGYKVILAHPERFSFLFEKNNFLNKLIEEQVILQINATSLLGSQGKKVQKRAIDLLKKWPIGYIASDAHSSRRRTFFVKEASLKATKIVGADYTEGLISTNGIRIINNSEIELPKSRGKKKTKGVIGAIKKIFGAS